MVIRAGSQVTATPGLDVSVGTGDASPATASKPRVSWAESLEVSLSRAGSGLDETAGRSTSASSTRGKTEM